MKLRKHFHDPIFVRTSRGMEPTPHGSNLIRLLATAEDMLQEALSHYVAFHPPASNRVFHLCCGEAEQLTLMPRLIRRLREMAPAVRIDAGLIVSDTPRQLESGAADVAVGSLQPMGAGFCHESLFAERLVCATRRHHPRVRGRLTVEEFQNETHLTIASLEIVPQIIEAALEANGIRRKVGLTLPSFLEIGSIVAATDFLVILPESVASHVADADDLQILALPFPLPVYDIRQHWHERYTRDPAVRWLRGVIAELFAEQASGRSDHRAG